jgi:trehalose 6-phosphate phosphatase
VEPPDQLDERLAPLVADPASSGIFSDFDGTLAAIVDDPSAARALDGVVDVLAGLARRYRRVGVISGRPAAFLADRLGGHGLLLSGLYGLETAGDDGVRITPEAEEWRQAVDEVVARAEATFGTGGAGGVERKGLSVTVHYRNDAGRRHQVEAWARREAERSGLALHPARMSVELRPPLARDKGTVLAEEAAGLRAACFLGDDRGDLEAFEALARLASDGVAVVRVAVNSDEAPAELLERADLVVEGPEGALDLLRRL